MLATSEEIAQLLGHAAVEGWTRAADELPPAGQRVDVMHVLARRYDTDGELGTDGRWHCCNGLVLPNMAFTFNPTHWRAQTEQVPA